MTKAGDPFRVSRTCTSKGLTPGELDESRPLVDFRDRAAYVLLGDPGAGKTTAFLREAEETGGQYVKARDFATFDPRAELQGKTMFIDALDEMRGFGDGRTPLDHIRKHLDRLGRPRFRISCREADWLGASDTAALQAVSPDGKIVALHLDPLKDSDVLDILRHYSDVSKPDDFVVRAREHGLEELLRNPQTLNLLVEAVGGRKWPEGRAQVYETACRQLAREKNPEHRQATRENPIAVDTLLDAAGYLCAIQLLSGNAGFSLDEEASDQQYFSYKELSETSLPLHAALKTNLFQEDGEQRRSPVHRSVAEYLGSRYLAARIEGGDLPFGRVLTLITGEDGGVVTDLRGLAAWLAAHCRTERHVMVEREPLGIVLYGDVRNFATSDKRLILAALKEEAQRYPRYRSGEWSAPQFGALGTPDMEPTFREILASPARGEADQALLDCVLDAIRYGDRMEALVELLDAIARDATYRPPLRTNAAYALAHVLGAGHARVLKLAEDTRDGLVEDRDDRILGTLLEMLYPKAIPVAQIFSYLHAPKQSNLVGQYLLFWHYHFLAKSAEKDIPELLDTFAREKPDLGKIWAGHQLFQMAGELLAHGLKKYGDTINDARIFEWLGVALDEYGHPRIDGEHAKQIASWFAARPARYIALMELGLSRCPSREETWVWMSRCEMRLYGAPAGIDLKDWYLAKIEEAAAAQNSKLAGYFFNKVIHLLVQQGGQEDLTLPALEFLESLADAHPILQRWLDPHIFCSVGDHDYRQENARLTREGKLARQQRKAQWSSDFRQHIADVRAGRAHPQVYYVLAQAHEGLLHDASGKTPRERLEDLLDGDQELVEAAYSGLRNTLTRDDLPTVAEIVDLHISGKMYYLVFACLVGMDELYQTDTRSALELPDAVLSRMLAGRFTYNAGNDPPWFDALLQQRPDLVAEVLAAYALRMLGARREHISGLHQLAYKDIYRETASIALPQLLEKFPHRVRRPQVSYALDPLLKGAMRSLDREGLALLVERKLAVSGMDSAQRVYWLGCGLLISPAKYESELVQYLGKSKARKGYLASFLANSPGEMALPQRAHLPESTLARLIELFVPDCSPVPESYNGWVTSAMNTSEMVSSFINTLGNSPTEAATLELQRLLTLSSLTPWHNHLRGALHAQLIARRKATFRRPGVEEIAHTLANRQPANAADLAALALDQLRSIARKIRDGNTNDYKQYWSYDGTNERLGRPKPENDCRDTLLSDMQERLGRLNIDAQREGSYAEDKRADIRVSYGGANRFNVPIEIKKDHHRDLWRAIREQLIEKYVRDPGADGYGIYLVFWFGGDGIPPPPDGGKKPRSSQELEDRLRQMLAPEEKHRIHVCVIDCARP